MNEKARLFSIIVKIFLFSWSLAVLLSIAITATDGLDLYAKYNKAENIEYVTQNKVEIVNLSSIENKETSIVEQGNSTIGKFFIKDNNKIEAKEQTTQNLTYFIKTKNGLQKKNLNPDKDNIFFQQSKNKPYIEKKVAKFKDKKLEQERKKEDLEQFIYIIYYPKEDKNIIAGL